MRQSGKQEIALNFLDPTTGARMAGRARRIGIMPEEGIPDGLVFFEGEVPLYEDGCSEAGIPEMKVHAEDRLQWASLFGGLRTVRVGVDPDGDFIALDNLSVAMGHVVPPKRELSQGNEAQGRSLAGGTKVALDDLDSRHSYSWHSQVNSIVRARR